MKETTEKREERRGKREEGREMKEQRREKREERRKRTEERIKETSLHNILRNIFHDLTRLTECFEHDSSLHTHAGRHGEDEFIPFSCCCHR
jgi:hypothetical protein